MTAIVIDIKGKEHELSYPIGALKALQKHTKLKGLNALMARLEKDASADDIGAMIWAGLLHENRDLKVEDVDWMFGNIMDLTQQIAAAISKSSPEVKTARPTQGKKSK